MSHHPHPHRTWRYLLALLAALALVAAACGDDGGDDDGSDDDSAETTAAAADAAYPVTIEHTFGETTIEEAPERVVTVGWGSTEAAIALGVYPVLIPFDDYAGDDEGILPWIREALEAADQPMPDTYPDSEGPAAELIAAAQPDLILAPYSGITDEQYEVLSQIAPTSPIRARRGARRGATSSRSWARRWATPRAPSRSSRTSTTRWRPRPRRIRSSRA